MLEVGRGGRYDDIAVVPNKLSLFTPIMLEHPDYLGPTLARIAWHKAGIIKPYSYAYSVPQPPDVLDVIQAVDALKRITRCPLGLSTHQRRLCPLHRRLDAGIALVEAHFGETTIAELIDEEGPSRPLCQAGALTSSHPRG